MKNFLYFCKFLIPPSPPLLKGGIGGLGIALSLALLSMTSYAADLSNADKLLASGQTEAAAKEYAAYANENPSDKNNTPVALLKLGQTLEKMSDQINTAAERACFRSPSKVRGTPCMKAYAEKLNSTYGTGAFEYKEQLVYLRYTGVHYKKVEDDFPKSSLAPEAAFLYLSKNLVGHPDEVLPRIKEYMEKYKDGEWGRRGRLLWARINEDIWWVHRKWSWVLYNWSISPEELIVKAEPYRQEALRSFEAMIKKEGNTEEGKAAKKEYELLKEYKDDGKLYGIVNESSVGGDVAKPGVREKK